MSDLVKRLRERNDPVMGRYETIIEEAADKIDFLEAALKAAIADIDYYKAEIKELKRLQFHKELLSDD